MVSIYIKEIKRWKPLSREEELVQMKKAKEGNREAYELILNSNLRFVFQVAKSYQNKGLPLEELIAEGNMGLIKAYEKFDMSRNIKFISYAVWWIRQSILNALYTNVSSIRLPLNKLMRVTKIAKLKNELASELLREPTQNEILERLDDPGLREDIQYLHTIIRLDIPRTEDGDANLHGVLGSDEDDSWGDKVAEFQEEFLYLISGQAERTQRILCMYYGVALPRSYNLREIGDVMGLTRERIRQIKEEALIKVNAHPESNILLEYL